MGRAKWAATLIGTVCVLMGARAVAEPRATLDHYRATARPEDGFMLSTAETGKQLGFYTALHIDYANDPLVFENAASQSSSERTALVRDQLAATALVSLGVFEGGLLYVGMPVNLVMKGNTLGAEPTATGFGPGDLRMGARLRVHRSPAAAVALQVEATAPTGAPGKQGRPGVSGDSGATFAPQMVADLGPGDLHVLLALGARWRPDIEFSGIQFSDALTFGGGLSWQLSHERLRALLEVQGESPMHNLGDRGGSVLDALLGLKLTPGSGWCVGLAGGSGLLRGYGSPDVRAVAMFGWASEPERERAHEPQAIQPEAVPVESEVAIEPDQPQSRPPIATAVVEVEDADHDGVPDAEDRCKYVPGTQEDGGCSTLIAYDEDNGQVVLLRAVRFNSGTDALHADGDEVLGAVASLLAANPRFSMLVEAHVTGAVGSGAAEAMDLSQRRARTVALWLGAHAVALPRLAAQGCGTNRPLVPDTGSRRFRNERIELYVTQPLPPSGLRSIVGCTPVTLASPLAGPNQPELPRAPNALKP